MLDRDLTARLADCGLAKGLVGEGTSHEFMTLAGSEGYLDPEVRRSPCCAYLC